jgi:hypothetical protein
MTSRNELEAFYAVIDALTANEKKALCKVLRVLLKPEGEETDKGNLSTNSVKVDMLLQELEITSDSVKAGLSWWASKDALHNLDILIK